MTSPHAVFELHRTYVDWSHGLRATPLCRLPRHLGYTVCTRCATSTPPRMPNQPVELVPLDSRTWTARPWLQHAGCARRGACRGSAFRIVEGVSPKLLP